MPSRRSSADTLARLRALHDEETLVVGDGQRRFIAPATVDALADVLLAEPEATIVAGCTDVGLWVTKQMRRLDPVVYLGRVRELQRIEETGDGIVIGAGVSHSDAMAALAPLYPDMGEMWRRFASVQIRNAGTVGGNIANGSPIGDANPSLIAAGATLAAAPRRGAARPAARGLLHRLRQAGPPPGRVRREASRAEADARARAIAPTRSASASIRTSRR